MLAGVPPFKAANFAGLVYKIVHGKPRSMGALDVAVPKLVEAVVRKALEKNPEQRWASAQVFAAQLAAAMRKAKTQVTLNPLAETGSGVAQHDGSSATTDALAETELEGEQSDEISTEQLQSSQESTPEPAALIKPETTLSRAASVVLRPAARKRTASLTVWMLIIAAFVGVGVGGYWFWHVRASRETDEPEQRQSVVHPKPTLATPPKTTSGGAGVMVESLDEPKSDGRVIIYLRRLPSGAGVSYAGLDIAYS